MTKKTRLSFSALSFGPEEKEKPGKASNLPERIQGKKSTRSGYTPDRKKIKGSTYQYSKFGKRAGNSRTSPSPKSKLDNGQGKIPSL